MNITLTIGECDHLALATYLDRPGVEPPNDVRAVLVRIVCQGTIMHGANIQDPAVNRVVCRERAAYNRAGRGCRRIPQAHRTGGPGQ